MPLAVIQQLSAVIIRAMVRALLRTALAILIGYVIFGGSAVVLFSAAHVDPHSLLPLRFIVFSTAYGGAFALLGGYVAGRIGRRRDLICGLAVAALIAMGAVISMVARPGAGALSSQTAGLVVCAPAALLGNWIRWKILAVLR